MNLFKMDSKKIIGIILMKKQVVNGKKTEIGHKLRKRLSDEIVDIYFYYGQKF